MSLEMRALRMPYLSGQMLDRGFTSVRDCGGAQASLKQAIKENIVQHELKPGEEICTKYRGKIASEAATVSAEISTVCMDAAMQIIDLVESLCFRGQLGLYSIVDIHSCSSAVTVLILSSIMGHSLETSH